MGSDIAVGEFMKPGHLAFLNSVGALDSEELGWVGTGVERFLARMEKTSTLLNLNYVIRRGKFLLGKAVD